MKYGIVLTVILQTLTVICWGQFNNTNYGSSSGTGGADNSFFGAFTGNAVTSGQGNTFVGSLSGRVVTTGGQNTFLGYSTGRATIGGTRNTFVGNESGTLNTSGSNNVFLGDNSGYKNTSGQLNTFLGVRAGYNGTIGQRNTYTGYWSGTAADASDNTFYGYSSGSAVTTGNQNTILGTSAGAALTTGTGNVFLGYKAGTSETGSNKLHIENSTATIPLIYGDFAADKVAINATPVGTHTLTVGGTIHSTGLYVNGQAIAVGPGFWQQTSTYLYNLDYNVGIGKANPAQKLDVAGIVNADGFQIGGVPLVTSPWIASGNTLRYDGVVGVGAPVTSNPNNYSLLVGGKLNATQLYMNDQLVVSSPWIAAGNSLRYDGAVGIGTPVGSNPNNYSVLVGGKLNATQLYINDQLVVSSQWVTGSNAVHHTGAVGIGTTLVNNPNNYMLAVNGGIGAHDVRVEKSSTTWPDYVFREGYTLPSLDSVEQYIRKHQHLSEVPSAQEVEANGHSVADMDAVLLKKVEELTLYVIQLQKEIEALKAAQKQK